MLTIRNTSSSDNPLENEDFLAELLQVGFHAMVAVAVLGFGAVSGHDRSACLVFFDTGNRVCSRLATPDRGDEEVIVEHPAASSMAKAISSKSKWTFLPDGAYIKIPCEFLFGGFRGVNSTMVENWTTAVHVSVSATGEYAMKSDLGADFFDAEMAQCPVLRHVRDCRVHSLYAGYMANSSAPRPYDLFTSNWSTSPYEMNKDYVIMSSYAALLNSAPPWKCTSAAVAGVGFPSDCGSEYGSFGEAATIWKDWFALPGNSSQDPQGVSFGAALEVFSGTRCPVQRQDDIEDLAAGRKRSQEPSGRDVWLAIRYFSCTFGGALCVVIFVIIRWKSAEVTFSIEHSVEEVSPIRWSRWVLGLRDFRLRTTEEKQLWGQALANLLRAEYEAETHAEREGAKKGWQRWLVTFKRVIGATLNITIIFGSWVAIAYSFVEQTTIQSFLNSLTQQEPLRSVLATIGAFAPNLVIAAAGQVLPFMTKTLTDFEAWEPAARARHNLWRLFFGKVLNATVFIALNVELLNDKPMLLKNRFLATRDCVNFVCAEDQAGMQVVSLTNSEFDNIGLQVLASAICSLLWLEGRTAPLKGTDFAEVIQSSMVSQVF
eukprot:s256_g10.t1